eukprot:7347833-Prymnesium_polylepis.1
MYAQSRPLHGRMLEYGSAEHLFVFLLMFVTCVALIPPSDANLPSGKAWLGHPPADLTSAARLAGVPSKSVRMARESLRKPWRKRAKRVAKMLP